MQLTICELCERVNVRRYRHRAGQCFREGRDGVDSTRMSKPLILTSQQASAVRTAIRAADFVNGAIHIDFGDIDVHALIGDDWIRVREQASPTGYEEHKGLSEFERRYELKRPQWDLLALAHDFESLCESRLEDAQKLEDSFAAASWTDRLERCRTAIAACDTNFDKHPPPSIR